MCPLIRFRAQLMFIMTKKNLCWLVQRLALGSIMGFMLLLSACSGVSIGSLSGNATPPATSTDVVSMPTTPPNLPAIPTVTVTNPNALLNVNLITNGNAEAGPGTTNEETLEPIPGWTRQGDIDVVQYAVNGGFIGPNEPGPSDRGKNYFWGGGENIQNLGSSAVTSMTQIVDLTQSAALLSQGNVHFTLSAWLGGYANQNDNARLAVQFVSPTGQVLSTATLGPVLAAERNHVNGLLQRTTNGVVPAGTVKINVKLTMTRTDGADNDGSADDLSLVFHT